MARMIMGRIHFKSPLGPGTVVLPLQGDDYVNRMNELIRLSFEEGTETGRTAWSINLLRKHGGKTGEELKAEGK